MHSFLDSLMPTVERIEDAPAAFETTLQSLMAWLRTTSRDANVHAFADAVTARIPELVGANLANTSAAPKDGEETSASAPETGPTGADAVVVPNESRRERPSANEVMTGGPAAADQQVTPSTPVAPDTAPAQGFAGFSQHVDSPA